MIIKQKRYYREDARANPNVLYVFGDNEIRQGLGGQAKELRGEPNAIGVATLKAPGQYWSDDDYAKNCAVIDVDLTPIILVVKDRRTIVFPLDGIGTGLSMLETSAPKTFDYLQSTIKLIESYDRTMQNT